MSSTRHARGALVAALTALTVAPSAQAQEYRLAGPEVAVYNLAGRAEIVQGSGSDVVVRVTRMGAEADQLDVQVGDVAGRMALRVVYPGDRIIYPEKGRRSSTNLRVRADGTFGGQGGGGDRVEIRGSGEGVEAWADLRIEVPSGRSIDLRVASGDVEVRSVTGDVSVDTGSGHVDVADVQGRLSVDTGSGNITVVDVRGSTELDTGSGSVRVDGVSGATIGIDTGSGRVEGGDLSTPALNIDTGSGRIELRGVDSPDVYLDTGSGSVEVELLSDVERLEIDTGSGSVTVFVTADLGAIIEVDTGSGGIDIEVPIELRTMRRNHVVGTLGDGRGEIRIDTGSGGVRVITR